MKKNYLINPTVKAATTGWVLGTAGENNTQMTGNPTFLQIWALFSILPYPEAQTYVSIYLYLDIDI